MALRPLLLMVLLAALAAPAAAQGPYEVRVEVPRTLQNLGQSVVAVVRVTDAGGAPVQGARVEVREDGQGAADQVTGPGGAFEHGLYHGSAPGPVTLTARLEAVLASGQWQDAEAPEAAATVTWTQVILALSTPAGPHPLGQGAPFTVTARWLTNGTPVAGARIHFVGPSSQYAATGADGSVTVHFTPPAPGAMQVAAGIDPGDAPQGIWATVPDPVNATFTAPPLSTAPGGPGPTATPPPGASAAPSAPWQAPGCPAPAGQDADADGWDDACDPDGDGDGVPDAHDAFPDDPSEVADADGDGTGDRNDVEPLRNEPDAQQGAPGPAAGLAALAILLAARGRSRT